MEQCQESVCHKLYNLTRNPHSPYAPHRPDVEVITANPKTAGVARWNFLALWGHRMSKGDAAAEEFVTKARSPGIQCNGEHNENVVSALSSCASTLSFCPIPCIFLLLEMHLCVNLCAFST